MAKFTAAEAYSMEPFVNASHNGRLRLSLLPHCDLNGERLVEINFHTDPCKTPTSGQECCLVDFDRFAQQTGEVLKH